MSGQLEIRLFGPPSVCIDGQPMPRLKTRKGMWLLALLALRHDRDVDRNWLAGTLWTDADETISLNYLRQALTDLRKALGPAAGRLESSAFRALRLDLESADCDVARFDELVAAGTDEALEEAISLYSGPLLEGCTEEWVFQERESRGHTWLSALETLASREIEAGKAATAIGRLRMVISADRLRESAHRSLMRALAENGDTASAMEAFRDLRLILRQELNDEPDAETRALYESVRNEARHRASAGPSRTTAVPLGPHDIAEMIQAQAAEEMADGQQPHRSESIRVMRARLPRFVSEFVGRGREIVAVRRCLAASRLVTLTGMGGVGKTRLAVRIAEEEASRFADGVKFVDFTPFSEPSLVTVAMSAALGLREQPSRSQVETIADFLETRSMLLVFDNCEHVLGACAEMASELLKQCPGVQILATSRQRLRIAGETEWRVPPLETPPVSIPIDPLEAETALRANEALALFVDRALRARPTIEMDLGKLRIVADICRRLDGIPLAIELAAARLQALSVAQVAERLEERFKLLVAGDVTAPGRQQTLRATVDWSHDLLSEDEKGLFRRLAVFAGGWTLEGAEAVCFGDASVGFAVMDGLASLVDKSLVLFAEPSGTGRYVMLETVREYARERLARCGDEAGLRQMHRDYYLNFAEEAAAHLSGPRQAEWLDRLEVEHDNLRAALDWCADDPGRISVGLRLAGALRRFWLSRVHCAEGRRRYTDLLRKDSGAAPTSERALALQGAGNMAFRLGDYIAAGDLFERALAIRREIGDRAGEAEMLANLGNVAYYQGEYDSSRQYLVRALALLRETGSQANALVALHGLGNVAFRTSDHASARALHEQGLAESRECGNRDMEAAFLVSLGMLHEADGERPDAKQRFEESLVIARELGDLTQETVCLTNLGSVTQKLGDRLLSAEYFREGLLLARDRPGNRDERVVAYLLEGVGILGMDASKSWPAAWLLAAGDALRASIAVPLPPQDKEEFDRALAVGRAALDGASFEAAWSEGASARVDVAISRALELVA